MNQKKRYRTAEGVPTRNGQRVKWTYTHHFFQIQHPITRRGVFIRLTGHQWGRGYRGKQMALVQFKANKGPSIVPLIELFLDDSPGEA